MADVSDLLLNYSHPSGQGDHEPLPGSVYRAKAFGMTFQAHDNTWCYYLTSYFICVTQIMAPLVILLYTINSIDWSETQFPNFEKWGVGAEEGGWMTFLTRTIGFMLMFAFLCNNVVEAKDNKNSWKKLRVLAIVLEEHDSVEINWCWLYAGAVVHSYVSLLIAADTFLLIMFAETPTDIVMDIVGLVFLFKIDHVAEDFSAIFSALGWDDQKVGNFYFQKVKNKQVDGKEIDDPDELFGVVPDPKVYLWSLVLNGVLVVVYMVLFLALDLKQISEPDSEMTALREEVSELKKLVVSLNQTSTMAPILR